ncbi:hypothetical protein C8Q79DRAFT_1040916 [Trametes meyenii]|nr:hypothetical protein C8Q79DRAFT_1040916 [Trametes meyenii]
MLRMSVPHASSTLHLHSAQAAMPSPQGHHPHALSQPVLPSQAQHRSHLLPGGQQQRQHYDISPIQVTVSHSQGYNQPPTRTTPPAATTSLRCGTRSTGSALSLGSGPITSPSPAPALAQLLVREPIRTPDVYLELLNEHLSVGVGHAPQRGLAALLNLRRTSESCVSDADTEDSSRAPLSRFGSIASINESEGREAGRIWSRGQRTGPSPHEQQHPLRHATSASHLSPNAYPVQAHSSHSPDALSVGQLHSMHTPPKADGYPSPSSASTVSAGSNGNHHQHTMTHDTTPAHTTNNGGVLQGQNHLRTNTSSELAYALQGEPALSHAYHHSQPSMVDDGNNVELQYPIYEQQTRVGEPVQYGYVPEQAHYAKGQQLGHFPTVYEGAGVPLPASGEMSQAYAAAGAIELSHMCVLASEFMGGYMQYS